MVYDPDYHKWMKYNHSVEAETWIKSANNVERPMLSMGNTDQGSELETTEKNPGPSKPSERLKLYIQVPSTSNSTTQGEG